MDKSQAMATLLAAYAKDASPEELLEILPFVTDAAPAPVKEADKTDKGMFAALAGLLARDSKPAPKEEVLTADSVAKLVADSVAKALEAQNAKLTKDKKAADSDEKEVEKMLEDEDPDEEMTGDEAEDPSKEDLAEDEESEETKEAADAAFANVVKAIQPLYKTLPKKEQKAMRDSLVKAKRNPSADNYAGIMQAVQSHKKMHDSDPTQLAPDTRSISKSVMEARNPHYKKA